MLDELAKLAELNAQINQLNALIADVKAKIKALKAERSTILLGDAKDA